MEKNKITESGPNMHQILRVFAETRVNSTCKKVKHDLPTCDLIKTARDSDCLYRFKKDIWFCCYKTKFEKQDSIMMVFAIELPGSPSGSSSASELIMSLISILEQLFSPIDSISLERKYNEETKENVGFLKIIKKKREENIL